MNLLASSGRTTWCGLGKLAAYIAATALFTGAVPGTAHAVTTVATGTNLTLIATADGSPLPTFQWRKNGVMLAGATNQTISILGATAADAGAYQVIATNEVGSATSPEEIIEIGGSQTVITPAIIAQPAAVQTNVIGTAAVFSAVVAGSPTPTFQWNKDGAAVAGATTTTLTIAAVAATDAGSYTLVATNSGGTVTSAPSVLTVTEIVVDGTAPKITTQPITRTVAVGASVSFNVGASGSPAPSYQWRKNGTNITGATASSLDFSAVSVGDAATYSVLATNGAGAAVSENAMLYVQSAPVITTQPIAQAATLGSSTRFTAAVAALPGATLQWKKNGVNVAGATSAVLLFSSVTSSDVGLYKLEATNALGSATSNEVALALGTPPIITTQPVSLTVAQKSNITFTVAASGAPLPTYQWKKNGVVLAGQTSATLSIKNVSRSSAGEYVAEARNVVGYAVSNRVQLNVTNPSGKVSNEGEDPAFDEVDSLAASGLINLSVRANAGTGSNGLIVGFVIDGTASKSVLVRGVGPALQSFGVAGALLDPQLALYTGASVTAANDDWSSNANVAQIVGASARVGAFELVDQASDSALMTTLANGAYTVQLTGKESSTGVALVEVYDTTANASTKLVNLSVRTYIAAGADAPTVGFVVGGSSSRRLLIRAVGPTLAGFGVSDAISDPQLELYRGTTRVDMNDNWGGNSELGTTFARVGAFGLSEASSKDSVLLANLEPGAYTVVVSGVNGAKGVGLVEVYDAP